MSNAEQLPPEEVWEVGPLVDPELGPPMSAEEFPVSGVEHVYFLFQAAVPDYVPESWQGGN